LFAILIAFSLNASLGIHLASLLFNATTTRSEQIIETLRSLRLQTPFHLCSSDQIRSEKLFRFVHLTPCRKRFAVKKKKGNTITDAVFTELEFSCK